MKKKLLLFFALIATFVCLFAITSSAASVRLSDPKDGIYYTIDTTAMTAAVNNDNAYNGTLEEVNIPETIKHDYDEDGVEETYVVTRIDDHAFSGNKNDWGNNQTVKTMVIPKTVNYIGQHFLRLCASIETVTIHACGYDLETGETSELSLTDAEFYYCTALVSVDMSNSNVVNLGGDTFTGCGSLTTVLFASNIKSISSSFTGCSNLATISSIETLETIGRGFYGTKISGDLKLPNLKSLGQHAFRETNITSIDFTGSTFTTVSGHSFRQCGSLTEVVLPDTVTLIGECAFLSDSKLTSINLPRGITELQSEAFRGTKITGDLVFDNLTAIGTHALRDTQITSLVIKGGLTSLNTNASLYGCTQLEYLILPSTVIVAGSHTFTNCNNLKYIVASGNFTTIGSIPPKADIIIVGNDTEGVANAFGREALPFSEFDPATAGQKKLYYGLATKDLENFYQFDGFDKDWCEWNATTNVKTNYAPVAEALGYSIREKGEIKDGIIAGFKLDPASREAYEKYFGEITLGVFVANAGKFTGNDFIVDGEITNTFGVQLEITQRDYHKINCTVVGMSETTDVPPLAYALYVLDSEGNVVDYIQKDDYASGSFANVATAGENTLIAVTLAEVEALISKE